MTQPPAATNPPPDTPGGAPFTVRLGTWDVLKADASPVRVAVFVEEQRIPMEMEWDEADATALHAVAHDASGRAIGTGRLLALAPGVARIGRMAVRAEWRGAGVGRALLLALLQSARERGDREAVLSAQRSAEAFYLREGFVARGEPYDEVGIPHIDMVRGL